MKAVFHKGKTGFDGVQVADIDQREPRAGEVKVRLQAAGLNHRDLAVPGRHGASEEPVVIGSDGAGIIEQIGAGVQDMKTEQEVVINPSLHWPKKSPAPPADFEILGLPDHGTFAESIIVPAEHLAPKPAHLSWIEAGVLPLGALTGYRALFTRGNVGAGQTIFIPGVGSGVATYMLQMAKVIGARVIVSSRSEEKRTRALELGADRAIDSNNDWENVLQDETIDLVIDSVGAATFNHSLSVLKKGGTMVVFGASAGDEVNVDLRAFFYGQYNLLGSTMGSSEEFAEMLRLVNEYQIRPVVDQTYRLSEAMKAFDRLEAGEQFGKIGLRIA